MDNYPPTSSCLCKYWMTLKDTWDLDIVRPLVVNKCNKLNFFSSSFSDKKSLELRRRKLAISGLYGSRIQCRFCNEKLQGNKQYFHHVRQFHLPGISKTSQNDSNSTIPLPEEITPQPTPIKKVWSDSVFLIRKAKNQRNPLF